MTQNAFRPFTIAQYLKFIGDTIYYGFALRLEVFGCNYTKITEDVSVESLGLGNHYILHSQLFADRVEKGGIEEIRLGCDPYFYSTGVFTAKSNFWQFDLGIRYHLVGIIAQGRCDANEYLKSLDGIQYTDDISQWYDDKSTDGEIRKYFIAHSNAKTELKFRDILIARHIRFRTKDLSDANARISMELYGYTANYPILNRTNKFPKEINASSQKDQISSANEALKTEIMYWCRHNTDVNSWWSADFGVIYYISKIAIYYKENSLRDDCKDIQIQGAQFNKTNMIDQVEVVFTLILNFS